jgi:hypothetical protein
VFVTAYARANLYSAILNIGNDYLYSDTDSVKLINYEKHEFYFICYNNNVIKKLKAMCNFHNLDYSKIQFKTNKNIIKHIGHQRM